MKKTSHDILVCESISGLMRKLGLPQPLHPLMAIIDYNKAQADLSGLGSRIQLGFYKVSLKTSFQGKVGYGLGHYDFEEGGMAFLAPDQVIAVSSDQNRYEGYSLFFHPDLMSGYPLAKDILQYGFFSYAINEALFLSEKEKDIIASLFDAMQAELRNNIDQYSQDILLSQIRLLLDHSNRFYGRQFITRKPVYTDAIAKLDAYLHERMHAAAALSSGLPTVQELAAHLALSPRYLSDMLKHLTGQTAQQYIHHKLIEKAKTILCNSSLSVAEVAYELGFEHPQ